VNFFGDELAHHCLPDAFSAVTLLLLFEKESVM
jgi:hypothetical protein